MDDIYKLYNKYASAKVNIKEYFDRYLKLIKSGGGFMPMKKDENIIMSLMGVRFEENEMSVLKNYCSADHLTVAGEPTKMPNNRRMRQKYVFDAEEPPDVDLKTIQNLKERLKLKNKKLNYKYQSEIFIHEEKKENGGGFDVIPGQDILVFVRIYRPFAQRTRNSRTRECGSMLRLSNVLAILGSQTIAQLRDKISCVADYSISRECSTDLDNAVGPMAKDVYKSGFIFIEETFYNDMRHPENIDYSKVIIDWAQRRPNLGPFHTALMEECRIDSLSLRFGFPWVYKHQGSCEHVIVFSNARLVNCDDDLSKSAYPKIVRLRPTTTKHCMICSFFIARWITLDHDRAPHSPCYFCDDCFKSYNYVDGKKVGNFEAYAYPRNIEAVKDKLDL